MGLSPVLSASGKARLPAVSPRVVRVAEGAMRARSRTPEDAEIGKRARTLRLQRGMSQAALADALDLTFQQIQKYEKGTNRISAGRLQRIAEVLSVPVSFFYSGMDGDRRHDNSSAIEIEFDSLQSSGAVRIARAYSHIKNRRIRQQLLKLAEALAGSSAN
jgi:transcriptional regulator with XRE-family HTH domain